VNVAQNHGTLTEWESSEQLETKFSIEKEADQTS
jgi:hypothetical protein